VRAVRALFYAVLLALISPSAILFDEGKFVDWDVAAIQKNKSLWSQQLVNESSLVAASLAKG